MRIYFKIKYLIFFLIISDTFFCQNLHWVKTFEGVYGGTDYCKISLDDSGNIYSKGVFYGDVDFDPSSANYNLSAISGAYNNFLCKMDSSGGFKWVKHIYSDGTLLLSLPSFDGEGNLIFSGNFSGTVTFDATLNINPIVSSSVNETFIVKLNQLGQVIWFKQFGENSVQTEISGFAVGVDNSIFICGIFDSSFDANPNVGVWSLIPQTILMGSYDGFLIKISSAGDFIWAKQFGGINGSIISGGICCEKNGNIILTGRFEGTVDVDPSALTDIFIAQSIQSSVFISSIDSSGNLLWANTIDVSASSSISGYSFVCDSKSNVILTGFFYGKIDFNPHQDSLYLSTSNSNHNSFILKLSSSGDFMWAHQFEKSTNSWVRTSTIDIDSNDNIYLGGGFVDTIDFDTGIDTVKAISNQSTSNFLLKISPYGIYQCFGSTIWDSTLLLMGYNYPSIAVFSDGIIYYASSILNTKDLDFTSNIYNITTQGSFPKLYIEKMTSCIQIIPESQNPQLILPNVFSPNGDGINDLWEIITVSNQVVENFVIYDRWGVIIKDSKNINFLNSKKIASWNGYTTSGNKCSDGVYFYVLEVKNNNGEIEKFRGYITLLK